MIVDIAAAYRAAAENRYWDLFFEIEWAYSVAEWDSLRERIAEFERDPFGSRLVPHHRCCNTGEPALWSKYRWERQYWGRSRMALVP